MGLPFLYGYSEKPAHLCRLLRHVGETGDILSTTPGSHGGFSHSIGRDNNIYVETGSSFNNRLQASFEASTPSFSALIKQEAFCFTSVGYGLEQSLLTRMCPPYPHRVVKGV